MNAHPLSWGERQGSSPCSPHRDKRQSPGGAEVFDVIEWHRFEGGDGSPVLDVLLENGCDSSGHDWW